MTSNIFSIDNYVENLIPFSEALIEFSKKYIKDEDAIETFKELNSLAKETKEVLEVKDIKDIYLSQINYKLQGFYTNIHIPTGRDKNAMIQDMINYDKGTKTLPVNYVDYKRHIKEYKFTLKFFKQIGFLNENIVAVGANGSGKSTLSNLLKEYMRNNCAMISAQKFLRIPVFNSIKNYNSTHSELKGYQRRDKTYKNDEEYKFLQNEFQIVLENIFADNNAKSYLYRNQARSEKRKNKKISDPIETNLDKIIEIWNSLITHREIYCQGGSNFEVKASDRSYQANKMSDGEKVVLFHVAQVLQAPENSFIIIDEPELFLHKTIINKLWDRLEIERKDCLFIYLTHDLDFASSRKTAKKLWIKSYTYPDNWEIESIPENLIPENLILELLGSRKTILFCEGNIGSLDEQILNYIFPEFTITPVSSCTNVINYTRAFNKIKHNNIKAVGLIDRDLREEKEINKLKGDKIFCIDVAEIESLFFSVNFLKLLEIKEEETGCVDRIKDLVFKELEKEKEIQISFYLSSKINTYFNNSHVSKGQNKENVINNFNNYIAEVKIEDWYNERIQRINKIINERAYEDAISIYNNKGLKKIANQVFKIKNFEERAFKLLQKSNEAKDALRNLFPIELIATHKN